MATGSIIGLKPHFYVHVTDLNRNITSIDIGPKTVVLKNNEKLHRGPLPMIKVPPGHYCVIENPCMNYVPGQVSQNLLGQKQYKFYQEPFPLLPGEVLSGAPEYQTGRSSYAPALKPLPTVKANHAIRLRALVDFENEMGKYQAGDQWQLKGPLTYFPSPEAEIEKMVEPIVLQNGEGLRLSATVYFTDCNGVERVTGEEWIHYTTGDYLPDVYEKVLGVEKQVTLTPDQGLRLQATHSITDRQGIKRLVGEEWLVTGEDLEQYLPEIGVTILSEEKRIVVKKGEYCIVLDVVDKNCKPQLGKRELRTGCCSFFLHPGETLENGKVQSAYILSDNEALVLQADEYIMEVLGKGKAVKRSPGDRWMIRGPIDYTPPLHVNVVDKRTQIPLSKNEGIYVQDRKTGKVRAEMGPQSYMLTENEELWTKVLPEDTETLLKQGGGSGSGDIRKMAYFEQSIDPQILEGRRKGHVVTFRCPGNTAVQVYNYLEKTARVVFGPDLVILGPHENFNVLSLSAGKPKKEGAMKSLCLMLGPDFITDILEVETSDHARLRIQLAFNNHFEFERGNRESELSIFSVPDFIGNACRQIGSRIRGAVAQVHFDEFHRHSAQVIKTAVFGPNIEGGLDSHLKFPMNNLVISSIDIQSIEPVDVKMRDSLSKSVQLAIEISTSSIEAAASHEAARNEQVAQGHLERQKLDNEKASEQERSKLLELQAIAAAVESTGQATAEAQARAERIIIECESEIQSARLKAKAEEIEHYAQQETQEMLRKQELSYQRSQTELEVHRLRTMADIEVQKFQKMVNTLGTSTISAIARSGPETQVKMLQGLGLSSVLITDGSSPINLFNTASGLIGGTGNSN
ncbi:major vault protein-like isoform X2 [Mizuhopecten yessoensis]|uniref:Major vault protein n=2 Tax=Mizuhopecten yessoensis TaxID=6573 RepID=A0A210Q8G1_MIZYE|nr:major vault protein-like isoform X2 [Mizuhopecten yessoensis]OWF45014.1 Major vault protein [Mizuhopecten yessoensis]